VNERRVCDLKKGDIAQYDDWPEAVVVSTKQLGTTFFSTWRVELRFPDGFEQPHHCFGPCELFRLILSN
jgi:hypothetical protein